MKKVRVAKPESNGLRNTLLIIVFGLLIGAGIWWAQSRKSPTSVVDNSPQSAFLPPSPTPDPTKVVRSFLLLGYGGGGHAGGQLTDSMMIARVDPEHQQITLLSLPRDLWVPLSVTEGEATWSKINAAYAIGNDDKKYTHKPAQYTGANGGGNMAKDVVAAVTGIPIDNYATVSFAGFTKGIDVLGGITVNVQRSFTDPQYPVEGKEDDPCDKSEEDIAALTATLSATLLEKEFGCRYEEISFVKGKMFMDGPTALKFVRSRHSSGDGGDFNRADRQRQVILGVRDKIFSVNFLPKAVPFVATLTQDFRTDLGLDDYQFLLSQAPVWRSYKVNSVALSDQNVLQLSTSPDRQSIVIPKAGVGQWQSVHDWVNSEILAAQSGSTPATPAATVSPH